MLEPPTVLFLKIQIVTVLACGPNSFKGSKLNKTINTNYVSLNKNDFYSCFGTIGYNSWPFVRIDLGKTTLGRKIKKNEFITCSAAFQKALFISTHQKWDLGESNILESLRAKWLVPTKTLQKHPKLLASLQEFVSSLQNSTKAVQNEFKSIKSK